MTPVSYGGNDGAWEGEAGDNPFLLKRLYILRTDSLETMSRLISNQPQG